MISPLSKEHGCVPVKVYLQQQAVARFARSLAAPAPAVILCRLPGDAEEVAAPLLPGRTPTRCAPALSWMLFEFIRNLMLPGVLPTLSSKEKGRGHQRCGLTW